MSIEQEDLVNFLKALTKIYTVLVIKNLTFDFKQRWKAYFLIKLDHQGQLWKIQDVRSTKLTLGVQFDAFMAEIFEVKVASSINKS